MDTASADRSNGFGALRLALASLVIVSHSYALVGQGVRDPLYATFGTMTSAAVAVTGFFLISGYLITSSFISDPGGYLWKRILRIYPAFVVCSLLCLFIVAPLGLAEPLSQPIKHLGRLVLLAPPDAVGVFPTAKYHALNGSMWTIAHEFRCYLLAAALGLLGFYRNRWAYLALTALVLVAATFIPIIAVSARVSLIFGEPHDTLRLLGAFMAGGCVRLFPIRFNAGAAAISVPACLALLASPLLAETGATLFGGYALFWLALNVKWKPLLTINAKDDISYGVYLYAWPIGALLAWYWRGLSAEGLMAFTLAGSLLCGWISWHVLEKPAMALKSWRPTRLVLAMRRI